jgi:hypothetical protein
VLPRCWDTGRASAAETVWTILRRKAAGMQTSPIRVPARVGATA